ncbi:MAG: hypothetical protein B7Y07_00275 [Halothiobacillus sp. 24-54-40]|nr:MAG: hypothetical protein B7Y07_00275 [Halothiobacillus sp. 24-54-40]
MLVWVSTPFTLKRGAVRRAAWRQFLIGLGSYRHPFRFLIAGVVFLKVANICEGVHAILSAHVRGLWALPNSFFGFPELADCYLHACFFSCAVHGALLFVSAIAKPPFALWLEARQRLPRWRVLFYGVAALPSVSAAH